MAAGGEEGRGKLRKASGSRKQALIRGCPNGGTWVADEATRLLGNRRCDTRGSETSQYPEEKKSR